MPAPWLAARSLRDARRGAGDGVRAAGHLLQMGSNEACPDRAGFVAAMADLFKR